MAAARRVRSAETAALRAAATEPNLQVLRASLAVMPNPSIERTSQRPLRALCAARSCRTLGVAQPSTTRGEGSMSADEDAKLATVCKLHLDLWLHQNSLMWGRVQTLWFVQAGFLALAQVLSQEPSRQRYALWACVLCALATFGLGVVMWTDRQLRDIHRKSIEAFNLNVFPASTSQTPLGRDRGQSVIEPAFHLFIFVIFIFVDLLAASVLGLPEPWVLGCALALLLGYILAVLRFYSLARPTAKVSKGDA